VARREDHEYIGLASELAVRGEVQAICTAPEQGAAGRPDRDPRKFGVCGINPHAGENGLVGFREEEQKIVPAIKRLTATASTPTARLKGAASRLV